MPPLNKENHLLFLFTVRNKSFFF